MPQWIVGLIGVVVGFALTQVTELIKTKQFTKKMKEVLEDELNTNLYQLDQKIDITNKMKKVLSGGRFLSRHKL